MSVVETRREGRVAVLEIANPPVNALSHAVRQGLMDALGAIAADTGIDAVVLTGAGRAFSGGADIREFGQPPRDPNLPELIDALEALEKPVVAAIHGVALGGGCELALGCHYRVAAKGASIGLPEVKLGLIPGAGGTQRLPRLIGAAAALDIIASGEPLVAEKALALGILDQIAEGDPVEAAIAFGTGRAPRRLSAADAPTDNLEDTAARILKRARGLKAPAACIEAVRGAAALPFAEGMARERALFTELREGEESKAQRHLFFAERAALKIPGMAKDTAARPVGSVAILGAGTMGTGIAMSFASAGIAVRLIDPDRAALERGLERVADSYARQAARGEGGTDAARSRIAGTTEFGAVALADMAIEAVFEDIDLKRRIFADLDAATRPGTVLATNTSSLDVDEIAAATARPEDVMGMHFFSPANVMRLVEVVRGARTSPQTLKTAIDTARRLAKVPVTVGVCHGFVGNRMLYARLAQVERLLVEGASPIGIDAAATGFGFAMGPCAVGDMAGLDIGWNARRAAGRLAPVADAICELGRFGQKTGRGYYRYQEGSRQPIPDPEIDALIAGIAEGMGVARREIGEGEIRDRLVLSLVNEGARILDQGIAARASDIDLIWVHGYGWPVARGGPMYHADALGAAAVAERLAALAAATGDEALAPAPLLARLAAGGGRFAEL